MTKDEDGYFQALVNEVELGCHYFYHLGDKDRPDPASRYQPEGVHGPSQVVDSKFPWSDSSWSGLPLEQYIFYEIHVGTFTRESTFEAIILQLDMLRELGITAIELMPVAQFPGNRNWGYDGVSPFAIQDSYGGPEGLKRLIDACHQRGIAVVLDVVYNHLGPEGNYLAEYGPYFTERYHTPWGAAFNFDGPYSDGVRRYFIENALYWINEFHIDTLRLDATHAYMDLSAQTFLEQLSKAVHQQAGPLNRRVYVIAENDRNDARLLTASEHGGSGVDAQWSDDLHHAIHTLLTEEQVGYYGDYGTFQHLIKALRDGWYYSGEYSPVRQRSHGSSPHNLPVSRFVVCAQNHDQVGNRMLEERLSQLVSFEALKLAAGIVLLSPYLPLLFMGEDYGEPVPFLYFSSYSDPQLIEAVRTGRAKEFEAFAAQGNAPDPQDEAVFEQSKLDLSLRRKGQHHVLSRFYQELIRLRKTLPALSHLRKDQMEVISFEKPMVLFMRRWCEDTQVVVAFNFSPQAVSICLPVPIGRWRKQIDSADERWRAGAHPGAFAPVVAELMNSDGEITFPFSAYSFIAFSKE